MDEPIKDINVEIYTPDLGFCKAVGPLGASDLASDRVFTNIFTHEVIVIVGNPAECQVYKIQGQEFIKLKAALGII